MAVGNALLVSLLMALDWILAGIEWLILIWVILSWIMFFSQNSSLRWRYRSVFNVLQQLNDLFARMAHPLLRPFRRLLPAHKTAGIDWSPLILLLLIFILRNTLRLAFGPILA